MKGAPGVGKEKPRLMNAEGIADRDRRSFAKRLRASAITSSELACMLNVSFPRASALMGGAVTPSGDERARLEAHLKTGA